MRLPIKPLTVNRAWQGRRFKTPAYHAYEKTVLMLLRPLVIPDGLLELRLEFGVQGLFDVDNGVKPFVDCLQKKYGFNDNRIYRLAVQKVKVPKGEEFIDFEIKCLHVSGNCR